MFGQARLPTIVGCILAAGCPAILAVTPAAIKFSDLLNDNRSTAWLTAIAGILSLAASALAFLVYFAQCQRQKTTQERGPEAASY
ncbi:hypothetical protein LPJ56_003762 [Coemansia sp. RSA 2599]|nr:hypothetical protein LPJ75_007327 [Coemansia sp. RSA 2598]KAJ1802286.1 hypothetical protein LPJ56_007242 [Coemansia sp. RSA 2599]KAJ1812697.1 hypothetical protein LPJ75_003526 [Coemansia sp. RSA 2598]KAJ1818870.1 hypothetical protein LPJ56_003762 [Coemansia sp. RSA 2599]